MTADDLFELQQQGDVTIVRFIENRALDSMAISQMSDSLFQVVDQEIAVKLVINLHAVTFISSIALNRLILLKNMIIKRNGLLKLVEMKSEVRQVFEVSRLDTLFDIVDDQATALEQLGQG